MERLIPFSPDVYVGMFARYNQDAWPAAALAVLLGFVTLICIHRREVRAGHILAFSVATFWMWTGWAFHINQYANLNWAAVIFGWLFILQGALTALWGGVLGRFKITHDTVQIWIGYTLMAAALMLHPLLASGAGDSLKTAQLFGTAPATTALIGVAAICFVEGRKSLWLLAWPLIWSGWDLASAYTMALTRDAPLPALTIAAAVYLLLRARR
ncbi:MAG: hypothetical protein JJ855_18150 [Rhodospirillales bacterium]|nr:hypothetical protein [Rhodospirillales bacterium]